MTTMRMVRPSVGMPFRSSMSRMISPVSVRAMSMLRMRRTPRMLRIARAMRGTRLTPIIPILFIPSFQNKTLQFIFFILRLILLFLCITSFSFSFYCFSLSLNFHFFSLFLPFQNFPLFLIFQNSPIFLHKRFETHQIPQWLQFLLPHLPQLLFSVDQHLQFTLPRGSTFTTAERGLGVSITTPCRPIHEIPAGNAPSKAPVFTPICVPLAKASSACHSLWIPVYT